MKKAGIIMLIILAFFIIYFLQANFFTWFNIFGIMPNLFVILILFVGLFAGKKMVHIPTHIYDPRSEKVKDYLKILCGTNLIYTQMENSRQWALPDAIENYNNICFLGIGMQQIGLDLPMSSYTKRFLKYIMSSKYLHSVRDEETKRNFYRLNFVHFIKFIITR